MCQTSGSSISSGSSGSSGSKQPWLRQVTVVRPGSPQQVLTDATSDRPRGKPPSWQHDRIEQTQEELGRRRMFTDFSRTNRGRFARDEYGTQKAYEDLLNTGTYYDPKTRTMYVHGSQTARD